MSENSTGASFEVGITNRHGEAVRVACHRNDDGSIGLAVAEGDAMRAPSDDEMDAIMLIVPSIIAAAAEARDTGIPPS